MPLKMFIMVHAGIVIRSQQWPKATHYSLNGYSRTVLKLNGKVALPSTINRATA